MRGPVRNSGFKGKRLRLLGSHKICSGIRIKLQGLGFEWFRVQGEMVEARASWFPKFRV